MTITKNLNNELSEQRTFFAGLRKRVFSHLEEKELKHVDSRGMAFKALLASIFWITSYAGYLSVGREFDWHAFWFLMPMVGSLLFIVLAIMHDASHGSFSRAKVGNRLAAYTLGFAGCSSILWHQLHVKDHHGNTNVSGYDQDFESGGLLRLHPAQETRKAHRFQQYYAWFLYLGFALRWVIFDDIYDWATNRCGFSKEKQKKLAIELLIVKTWHIFIFLAIPIMVVGWQVALSFYLAHWMILSIALILIFATAHLSGQEMPLEKGEFTDYALHQLATTTNYATENRFVGWFTGGLNFQIEHHIFPGISHTRYPEIQTIVKDFCWERGVQYNEFPTVFSVVRAHYRHLKKMGAAISKT